MAETQRRRSSRHKIEPLNYAEAALSPALKGMTSFLDVSPENVRNQDFHEFGPQISPAEQLSATPVTYPGDETAPAVNTFKPSPSGQRAVTPFTAKRPAVVETTPPIETVPDNVKTPPDGMIAGGTSPAGDVLSPGDETDLGDQTYAFEAPAPPIETVPDNVKTPPDGMIAGGISPAGDVLAPGDETGSGDQMYAIEITGPPIETVPDNVKTPPDGMIAGGISPAGDVLAPGDETGPGDQMYDLDVSVSLGFPTDLTPGRGRSKIRRCVLAQDGHSLGEEAIYQVLWRTGRAENSDPNGSRTNRMGAADIGFKVNMAKKNVRQNISRLFEKLALEILEDFETMNSQARLYRVYSYKQILERRRAAGLEYVLRNKGVVFCSQDGRELVSSPAYVSSPGGKTSIKPAPPKKRRTNHHAPEAPKYPQTSSATPQDEPSDDADLQVVSQALNRYWTVDQAAAVQLLRDCRRVRPDAHADEIAFFVQEKLELSRNSRSITNPTGLVLATVPQSFVGSSFEQFRRRMERHAKLQAEEMARKKQQEAELTAWILKDRERYESIVSDPSRSDTERDEAEKRLRELSAWNT
jgi:hypothetical protein